MDIFPSYCINRKLAHNGPLSSINLSWNNKSMIITAYKYYVGGFIDNCIDNHNILQCIHFVFMNTWILFKCIRIRIRILCNVFEYEYEYSKKYWVFEYIRIINTFCPTLSHILPKFEKISFPENLHYRKCIYIFFLSGKSTKVISNHKKKLQIPSGKLSFYAKYENSIFMVSMVTETHHTTWNVRFWKLPRSWPFREKIDLSINYLFLYLQ